MIIEVQVKKLTTKLANRTVAYCPRSFVRHMKEPASIISIEYYEEERPDLSKHKRVLKLISLTSGGYRLASDTGVDPTPLAELTEVLSEFMESCAGEPVIVHCEMGMVRSKNFAQYLSGAYDYKLYDKGLSPSVTLYRGKP